LNQGKSNENTFWRKRVTLATKPPASMST
jgi:hypothetical protein